MNSCLEKKDAVCGIVFTCMFVSLIKKNKKNRVYRLGAHTRLFVLFVCLMFTPLILMEYSAQLNEIILLASFGRICVFGAESFQEYNYKYELTQHIITITYVSFILCGYIHVLVCRYHFSRLKMLF